MIRVDVTVHDLAQTRLTFSPLLETIGALRCLHDPARHAIHLPWLRWATAEARRSRLATPLVLDLVIAPPTFLEFLVPASDSRVETLDVEIERLLTTPAAHARRRGLRAPVRTLRAYAAELRAAHDLLVAPHWSRVRALLEADVLHRARQLADRGASALFAGLDPRVRWHDDGFTVDDGKPPRTATVARGGLVLQPSAFLWPDVWVKPASITHTTVRYPARGLATLWDDGPPEPQLAALVSAPRAHLLALLRTPATTGDLAARLDVTPSAVSQHLRVLRDAGLVTSTTVGRSRIHALAERGRVLTARSPLQPG